MKKLFVLFICFCAVKSFAQTSVAEYHSDYFDKDYEISVTTEKRRWKHFVNISLYNATARRNALFYSISVSDDALFRYHRVYFMPFPLPSISYTVKF